MVQLIRLPMHNTVALNKQSESNSSSTVAGAVPDLDWLPVSPALPNQSGLMGKNKAPLFRKDGIHQQS